jgi:hypothetical protein
MALFIEGIFALSISFASTPKTVVSGSFFRTLFAPAPLFLNALCLQRLNLMSYSEMIEQAF